MKKFLDTIKTLFTEKSLSQNVALIFFAVIITFSMSTLINEQVDEIHSKKMKSVSITFMAEKNSESIGYDVCIIDNSSKAPRDAFKYILQALEKSNIEYTFIEKENKNAQDKILFNAKVSANETFTFECPYYSNISIDFALNSGSGKIRVDCEKFSREYDLYIAGTRSSVRCTPICESYSHLIPYFIIYILTFLISVLIVYFTKKYLLDKILLYCYNKHNKITQYNIKIDFPILFVLLSLFSLILYFTGIVPDYLEGGDQNHYWNKITSLSNLDDFKTIPDFRGYLCYLIPTICKDVESNFGISAVFIWIIFLNLLAAVLFGIIFPILSRKLYNTDITRMQVYLSAAVFDILFCGQLLYVVMDLPAAVFFFAGLTLYIYFLDSPSPMNGMFCGICFSAAINFRNSYKIAVFGAIIVWSIYTIIKNIKSGKSINIFFSKKYILYSLTLILGFTIICIPQFMINCSKEVISPFPFEVDSSWSNKNYTITELSPNGSFDNLRSYPGRSKADSQVQSIKIDYIGDIETILNFQQLFEMFIRKPMDTLVYMMKKIFLGFNTMNPFVYANSTYTAYKNSFVWLSCLLNYTVLYSGIYSVFKSSKNTKEKIIFFIVFVFTILPLTLVHVEWRYYLPGYLLVNFLFTYHFLPKIYDYSFIKSEKNIIYINSYCRSFVFFILSTIVICTTIT